jgi:hypothetical protein
MKKLLIFVLILAPLGVVVSLFLAILLSVITFWATLKGYWTTVFHEWFGPNTIEDMAQKQETVWEKHQRKIDEQQTTNKGSTNNA